MKLGPCARGDSSASIRGVYLINLQSLLGWFWFVLLEQLRIPIRVNNPTLNRNIGNYNLTHIWDGVLDNNP